MKLRGALLGAGNIALRGHAPQWSGDVARGVRRDRGRGRPLAGEPRGGARGVPAGAACTRRPRSCSASETLDFVDICTPPFTHRALVEAACERRLHVRVREADRAVPRRRRGDRGRGARLGRRVRAVPPVPPLAAVAGRRAPAAAHRARAPRRVRGAPHGGEPGQPELVAGLEDRPRAGRRRHPVRPRRAHLLPAALRARRARRAAGHRAHAAPRGVRRRGLGVRRARLRRPAGGGPPDLGGSPARDPLPVRRRRRRARRRRGPGRREGGDDRGGLVRGRHERELVALGVVRTAVPRLCRARPPVRHFDRSSGRGDLRGAADQPRLPVLRPASRDPARPRGCPRGEPGPVGRDRGGVPSGRTGTGERRRRQRRRGGPAGADGPAHAMGGARRRRGDARHRRRVGRPRRGLAVHSPPRSRRRARSGSRWPRPSTCWPSTRWRPAGARCSTRSPRS